MSVIQSKPHNLPKLAKGYDGSLQPDFTVKAPDNNSSSVEALETKVSEMKDTFIKMMCATVKNQSPDDPADVNAMTQTMASMASAEASMLGATGVAKLNQTMSRSALLQAKEFQGQEVYYDDSERFFSGNSLEFEYDLNYGTQKIPENARVTSIVTVLNDKGVKVYSSKGDIKNGKNRFLWSGKDDASKIVNPGTYRIKVEAYYESVESGALRRIPIETNTYASGIVEAIEAEGDKAKLLISGKLIDQARVKKIVGESGSKASELTSKTALADYSSYLGKNALVKQEYLEIQNGQAEVSFTAEMDDIVKVKMHVYDEQNKLVAVAMHKGEFKAGYNHFTWDAKAAKTFDDLDRSRAGTLMLNKVPSGRYRYEIYAGTIDGNKEKFTKLKNQTEIAISGLDFTGGAYVMEGENKYRISDITRISSPGIAPPAVNPIAEGSRYIGKRIVFDDDILKLDDKGDFTAYLSLDRPKAGYDLGDAKMRIYEDDRLICEVTKEVRELYYKDQEDVPSYAELNQRSQELVDEYAEQKYGQTFTSCTGAQRGEIRTQYIIPAFRSGNLARDGYDDLSGKEQIATRLRNMGRVPLVWNGQNSDGAMCKAGTYRYEIWTSTVNQVDNTIETEKLNPNVNLLVTGFHIEDGSIILELQDGRFIEPSRVKSISIR